MNGRRSRRGLLVVVLAVLLAGGGALVLAHFIRSPAQLAAEAQPPPSGPVTVPVERRVLRTTMVIRGQVEPERSFPIAAPSPRAAAKPVVTRLTGAVGDRVAAGDVLAEVSGRPVIVLPSTAPAYRDITPGAKGEDVTRLQDALRSRGYRITDPKGEYGASTKAAVVALYRAAGYDALPSSDNEAQQLRAAQRQVRDLQRAHDAAPPETRAATAQSLADAQQDLADLEARTGPTVPLGEIAFVPTLPARIASHPVRLGGQVTESLMTLAGGDLVVRAHVEERQAQLVRAGLPVEIVAELRGQTAKGSVATVDPASAAPADTAADGAGRGPAQQPADPRPTITVRASAPLSDDLAGQNVRLTIISASTDHEVLVVPLAAVSARTDGAAVVSRVVAGREERVTVTPGVSGGGFVEVTPAAGELAVGDRVVIGR